MRAIACIDDRTARTPVVRSIRSPRCDLRRTTATHRGLCVDARHAHTCARTDDGRAIPAGAAHVEIVARGGARVPGMSALEGGHADGFWRGAGTRARDHGWRAAG